LEEVLEFIGKMPIRKIPYIGGMKETGLHAMGFITGKDLRDRAADLMIAFTEHEQKFLIKCGMGLGQTRHGEDGSLESFNQKGISISETFRPRSTLEQFKEKIA
jgi:nucleotidyltransferase/DNA polymerase involved in DNA repair